MSGTALGVPAVPYGQVPARSPDGAPSLAPGKWRQEHPDRRGGPEASTYGSRSEDAGKHLLGNVGEQWFLLCLVGLPGGGVPDLDPGHGTDDRALTVEPGVVS